MKTIWTSHARAAQASVDDDRPNVDDVRRQVEESDALRIIEEWTKSERARAPKPPAHPLEWNLPPTGRGDPGAYWRP